MSKFSILLSQVENGINPEDREPQTADRGYHINKPFPFRQIDPMLHCMLDCRT